MSRTMQLGLVTMLGACVLGTHHISNPVQNVDTSVSMNVYNLNGKAAFKELANEIKAHKNEIQIGEKKYTVNGKTNIIRRFAWDVFGNSKLKADGETYGDHIRIEHLNGQSFILSATVKHNKDNEQEYKDYRKKFDPVIETMLKMKTWDAEDELRKARANIKSRVYTIPGVGQSYRHNGRVDLNRVGRKAPSHERVEVKKPLPKHTEPEMKITRSGPFEVCVYINENGHWSWKSKGFIVRNSWNRNPTEVGGCTLTPNPTEIGMYTPGAAKMDVECSRTQLTKIKEDTNCTTISNLKIIRGSLAGETLYLRPAAGKQNDFKNLMGCIREGIVDTVPANTNSSQASSARWSVSSESSNNNRRKSSASSQGQSWWTSSSSRGSTASNQTNASMSSNRLQAPQHVIAQQQKMRNVDGFNLAN